MKAAYRWSKKCNTAFLYTKGGGGYEGLIVFNCLYVGDPVGRH